MTFSPQRLRKSRGDGRSYSGAGGSPVPRLRPHNKRAATIGGINAKVTYAGEASGETIGLQQINIQVPAEITPGPKVAIVLAANGASSQAGVTVAVK